MDEAKVMLQILKILKQLNLSIEDISDIQYKSIKDIIESIWWDGFSNNEE
jgi:hypothetical protein